jgi:hypothetical protein
MRLKRSLSIFLIVLLLVGLYSFLQFVPVIRATGANWLTGWSYRRSHVIGSAVGAGTNYQVQIVMKNGTSEGVSTTFVTDDTITLNNKTRADFGDVRFTQSDGSTLLNYWNEVLTSGLNATFWINIVDNLTTTSSTMYVYYGKSDATTVSNGTSTFSVWFDDFSINTIGNYTADGGTWAVDTTHGWLNQSNLGVTSVFQIFPTGLNLANVSVLSRIYFGTSSPHYDSGVVARAASGKKCIFFQDSGVLTEWDLFEDNPSPTSETKKTLTDYTGDHGSLWHNFRGEITGGTCIFFWDSMLKINYTGTFALTTGSAGLATYEEPSSGQWAFDYIAVRNVVSPEPAHSTWGGEEISNAPAYQYVSSTNSQVDAVANVGTQSSFAAEQAGPDNVNDTLTEANTVAAHAETYVYAQSNTVTLSGWTNPTYAYDNNTAQGATNTTSTASFWTGYLTLNFTDTVVGTLIRYMVGRSSNTSSLFTTMELTIANSTGSWFVAYNDTPTYAAGTYFNATFASSTYTAMRYRFYRSTGTSSRVLTLYETQAVNATWTLPANYQLNIEEQFTSANFTRGNVELCVFMGLQNNSETLQLDYWNASSSAWVQVKATLTANAWNNASVAAYTTNSSVTFTIRFYDNNRTGDSSAVDNWQKDCTLLHTWDTVSVGEYSYVSTAAVTISGVSVKAAENSFASSNVLAFSGLSGLIRECLFTSFASVSLSSLGSFSQERLFTSTNILAVSSLTAKTSENSFGLSGYASLLGSAARGLETVFASVGGISLFGSVVSGVEAAFAGLGTVSLLSSSGVGLERLFSSVGAINLLDSGLASFQVTLNQEFSFVVSGIVNVLGSSIGGLESLFASSNVLDVSGWNGLALEKGYGYSGATSLLGSAGKSVENLFTSASSITLSALGGFAREQMFAASNVVFVSDFTVKATENHFVLFNAVNLGDFASLALGNVREYVVSSSITVLGSVGKSVENLFASSSSVAISSSSLFGLEGGYVSTSALIVSGLTGLGREHLFSASNILSISGLQTRTFETSFGLSNVVSISRYIISQLERSFASTGTINLLGSNGVGLERLFASTGTVNLLSVGLGQQAFFYAVSGIVNVVGTLVKTVERGFADSGTLTFSSTFLFNRETFYSTTGTITLSSLATRMLEKGYASSAFVNLVDLGVRGFERGFTTSELLSVLGSAGSGLERIFSSVGTINLLASPSMTLEMFQYQPLDLTYAVSSIINILGSTTKNVESLFASSNIVTLSGLSGLAFEKGYGLTVSSGLLGSAVSAIEMQFGLTASLGLSGFAQLFGGNNYAYAVSGLTQLLSSTVRSSENLFTSVSTLTLSALGSRSLEVGFAPSNIIHITATTIMLFQGLAHEYIFIITEMVTILGINEAVGTFMLPLGPGGGIIDEDWFVMFAAAFIFAIVMVAFLFARKKDED